jgi:hypothetical protein
MNQLDWIGRIVAWIGSLALCGGVFIGSLFALVAAVEDGATHAATDASRYSTTLTSPPMLEADAFDVRKVAAFLAEPRTKPSATPPPQPALEQVRSIATMEPAPTPVAGLGAGTPDSVGSVAVNLRAQPSKNAMRLATLEPGEPIHVVKTSGGWAQVATSSGETGWVYGRYLRGAAQTEVLTALDVVPDAEPQDVAAADIETISPASIDQRESAMVVFLSPPPKSRYSRRTEEPVSPSEPTGSPFWDYD